MYKKIYLFVFSTIFVLLINNSSLRAVENNFFKLNDIEKINVNNQPFYKIDYSYEFNERDTVYIKDLGIVPAKGNFIYLTNNDKIEFKESPHGSILETIEFKEFDSSSEIDNSLSNNTNIALQRSNRVSDRDESESSTHSVPSTPDTQTSIQDQLDLGGYGVPSTPDSQTSVQANANEAAAIGNHNAINQDATQTSMQDEIDLDAYGVPSTPDAQASTSSRTSGYENNTVNDTDNSTVAVVTVSPSSEYIATTDLPNEKEFSEVSRHEDWTSPPVFQKALLKTLNKFFPYGVMPFQRQNTIFFVTPYISLKTVPDNLKSQVALLISVPLSIPDENDFFRIQVLSRERRIKEAKWSFEVSNDTLKASSDFINKIIENLKNYQNK